MALNATIGATTSNSYVTLAEAEAYFEDRFFASAWVSLTDIVKEQLLVSCSQMLDWYLKWKGTKTSTTQFMLWPREGALRADGEEIEDDIIPPELKVAVYELVISSIAADRMEDDPLAGLGSVKVGPLTVMAGPEKPNQTTKKAIPEKIRMILKDITSGSGGVVRLLRA